MDAYDLTIERHENRRGQTRYRIDTPEKTIADITEEKMREHMKSIYLPLSIPPLELNDSCFEELVQAIFAAYADRIEKTA